MLTQLLFATLASALLVASPADAHVSLANPAPRGGNTDANNPPYNSQGTMWPSFPCQGKPAGPVTATLQAGGNLHVDMVKHVAVHRGGHCQWAVSYDQGKTFVRIQANYNNCPGLNKYVGGVEQNEQNDGTSSWDIKIPADLPAADRAIFAWSWVPTVSGPAEYYMNCVDVKITGSNTGSFSGPQMVVVNTPGTPLIQNDLARLRSMMESAPQVTVSGSGGASAPATGGNSGSGSGCGSRPSPPPAAPSGPKTGAEVGCPDGMCKSKFGFCGMGDAYCNGESQVSAALDDANAEDADEEDDEADNDVNYTVKHAPAPAHVSMTFNSSHSSSAQAQRGFTVEIPDQHLWERGQQLVGDVSQLEQEIQKLTSMKWTLEEELEQVESELQIRQSFDHFQMHRKPEHREHKHSKAHGRPHKLTRSRRHNRE